MSSERKPNDDTQDESDGESDSVSQRERNERFPTAREPLPTRPEQSQGPTDQQSTRTAVEPRPISPRNIVTQDEETENFSSDERTNQPVLPAIQSTPPQPPSNAESIRFPIFPRHWHGSSAGSCFAEQSMSATAAQRTPSSATHSPVEPPLNLMQILDQALAIAAAFDLDTIPVNEDSGNLSKEEDESYSGQQELSDGNDTDNSSSPCEETDKKDNDKEDAVS